MKREKERPDFNPERMCSGYFEKMVEAIERKKNCGLEFSSLDWEASKVCNSTLRLERENKKSALKINLNQDMEAQSKEALTESGANFYCFITRYQIDGDIEDKFPEHTIHYDLLDRSLNRIGTGIITGKVFQSRVIDPSKKLDLVINDLASNVCKTISDQVD